MAQVLLLAVALDALVARFGVALIGPRPLISLAAGFTRSFIAVLALLTSFVGVYGLLRQPRRFHSIGRALVALTSAAFLPLAALSLTFPLPDWTLVHIHTTFVAAIAGLLALAYVAPAHVSARTGIFCLAVAPLAYGAGLILSAYAPALPAALGVFAEQATSLGRAAALVIGVPALMVVQPARLALAARGRPMLLAALGTLAIVVLVGVFPGLPGVLLGIPRPMHLAGRALGLASVVMALLALNVIRGVSPRRRAIGRGLSLLLLTGYLLGETENLLVVHAAFVLLVQGATLGAPSVERWRDYLAALALRAEAGEPVVIDLRGEEISRMRIDVGPVDVRVARRGDEIVQIDVTAGAPPKSAPAWSARHRRAEQSGSTRLPEASGRGRADLDTEIDRQMVVRGDGAVELDEELRRLLLALPPGALAVWPAEGARWRACPAATRSPDRPIPMDQIEAGTVPAPEDFVGVLRVVREVARRAGIRC